MIYLLEDDDNIRNFVIYALNNSGFEAMGFGLPSEFWAAMDKQMANLAILDIMLPEEDGISVLKKLRANRDTADLPVIMLTAKSTEYDKVLGLDGGADDYVTKPFGTMELMARVKALLRRTETVQTEEDYTFGALYLNPIKHVIRIMDQTKDAEGGDDSEGGVHGKGRDITLTLKEFQLLCFLAKNQGKVMTRDQILQEVWGYEFDGENRTVDVHIRTLRSKLGEAGNQVETIRGIGYRIGGRE